MKKLPKDVRVEIYDAIIEYGLSGTISAALKPVADALFTVFRARIDVDRAKYESKINALREAGKRGGLAKASKCYQKLANAKGGLAKATIVIDNDNVVSNETNNIDKSNDLSPCRFEEFWNAYPKKRRVNKRGCLIKWKLHKLDAIADTIIADVKRKSLSHDWTKEGGQFAPMTQTYINQRRWENYDGESDNPADHYADSVEKMRAMGLDVIDCSEENS